MLYNINLPIETTCIQVFGLQKLSRLSQKLLQKIFISYFKNGLKTQQYYLCQLLFIFLDQILKFSFDISIE